MFLQFVPKTHLFFTAGKDKKIKQWDADKFEHIQTLEVITRLHALDNLESDGLAQGFELKVAL